MMQRPDHEGQMQRPDADVLLRIEALLGQILTELRDFGERGDLYPSLRPVNQRVQPFAFQPPASSAVFINQGTNPVLLALPASSSQKTNIQSGQTFQVSARKGHPFTDYTLEIDAANAVPPLESSVLVVAGT